MKKTNKLVPYLLSTGLLVSSLVVPNYASANTTSPIAF